MLRECRERFPRHLLQRTPPVSDPGMHYGTGVTHVPNLNVPGIHGARTTHNFAYLVTAQGSVTYIYYKTWKK